MNQTIYIRMSGELLDPLFEPLLIFCKGTKKKLNMQINCRKYATKVQNTCIIQKKAVPLQPQRFEYWR